MYNPNYTHNSSSDYAILNSFENMILKYNKTIVDHAGLSFNQSILTNTIVAYLRSKYLDSNKNKTRHFFNEMRKAKQDFERKTHIKFSEIKTFINDEAFNFLLRAAKEEFSDDQHMEEYQEAWTDSMATFGTAVKKIVHRGKGKNIVEIVPWETFLCDPVNGEKLPSGQVTLKTIVELKNDDKYDRRVIDEMEAHLMNSIGEGYDEFNTSIRRYEIHGQMPKSFFGNTEDIGFTNGMYVILETEDSTRYVAFKSERSTITYTIDKINPIFGRTMGFGPMEAMIEFQIMANKLGNLAIDNVEASRLFYQTSDKELDGTDLQEITWNTLISHSEDAPITQVSASPQGFGPATSFLQTVTAMGRESASIQDASVGRGPKSNVSFAAIQANAKEADGVYTSIRDRFFTKQRKDFKRKGGFLDMIIDYFSSGKAIENLLTPEDQLGFRKFIARKEASMEAERQIESGAIYVDSIEELTHFFLKEGKGTDISITFKNEEIDRDYIIDKTRLTYNENDDIISGKIAVLEMTLAHVERNPQAYPGFNANDILLEINELSGLIAAHNSKGINRGVQSGQIAMTPTGPQVASESGL
jgi:hypothetical protein